MAKLLRWASYAIAFAAVLVLIAAAGIWLLSWHKLSAAPQPHPERLAQPMADQLADAPRHARVLGCFSCHGEGLRGNKMIDEPILATVWAPNLTQVASHATDEELARAIRQGISDEGTPLMIMPSEVYQNLSDQEVAALIAMIRKLPRGGSVTPEKSVGPIGRLGLVMGKFKTAPELVEEYGERGPIPAGPQNEAGRRLAVLNCSGCHNADLTGKEVRPGSTSPDLAIVGAYDPMAFKTLLRTGKPAGGQTLRMMGPTARSDLSHMTDSEIDQLYAYLRARAEKVSR